MSASGARLPDDGAHLRALLVDPRAVCAALGLLSGPHLRQARGVVVCCPWHRDRSPSCSVYVGTGQTIAVRCHGCEARGDVLSLVAAVRGLDPRRDYARVLEEAAALARVRLDDAPPSMGQGGDRVDDGLDAPLDDDAFGALATRLLEVCPVSSDDEVASYLEGRGVLGLAQGWGALPADPRALDCVVDQLVEAVGRDAWLRSGLAHRRGERAGRWVYSAHRLVIPWRMAGVDGAVASIQRRLVRPAREDEPKYILSAYRPPRAPFGVEDACEEVDAGGEVYVVEGALDTLAVRLLLRRAGRHGAVVGLPGVEHWRRHLDALAPLVRGRTAVVALDADDAGERHVGDLARALLSRGAVAVERSRPATGKDWCDVLSSALSQGG